MTHLKGLRISPQHVETQATHLQDPSTGHWYIETLTKKQHTENRSLVCENTNNSTYNTPARLQNRSPLCGNTNNTNETITRPENRSTVCGNTSDTLTKPKHKPLVCGNTNNINNTPRIGHQCVETLTIQMTNLQDLRTGCQCMKTLYKQHTNKA